MAVEQHRASGLALAETLLVYGRPPDMFAIFLEDGPPVSVTASALCLSSLRARCIILGGGPHEVAIYGIQRPGLVALLEYLCVYEVAKGKKTAVWYRKELRKRLPEGSEIEGLAQIYLAAVQLHAHNLKGICLQLLVPRLSGLQAEPFANIFRRLPPDFVLLAEHIVQSRTQMQDHRAMAEVLEQARVQSLLPHRAAGGRGFRAALESLDERFGAFASPCGATRQPSSSQQDTQLQYQ